MNRVNLAQQNLRMKILLYVGASPFLCTKSPPANLAHNLKAANLDFSSYR